MSCLPMFRLATAWGNVAPVRRALRLLERLPGREPPPVRPSAPAARRFRGVASCLFFGLFASAPAAFAGQGMYVDVDACMPAAAMSIDGVQCMAEAPRPLLALRQYVEASDDWSCLSSPSTFALSIWSAAHKVASYSVSVSAWGSRVERTFDDPAYPSVATLYSRFGLVGSQDALHISSTAQDMASWMGSVNPRLQVGQLVLPGTHDSGTAGIDGDSRLTPDAGPEIVRAAGVAPALVAGWSRTQSVDVAGQLRRGSRYLDLRLCGGSDVDSIYTCHAMAGEKFSDVVRQVREFVSAHQSELVIMDMNHWYPTAGTEQNLMRNSVYQYLQAQLGPLLAGRDRYGPTSMLGALQAARRTVIAASDRPMGYGFVWTSVNTPDIGACGDSTDICSYWPHSARLEQQTQRLSAVLDTLRSRPHPYLFVVQTQLTPDLDTIERGLSGGQYSDLGGFTGSYKHGMREYLDTPHRFDGLSGLILIEDFSDGIDLTRTALGIMGG